MLEETLLIIELLNKQIKINFRCLKKDLCQAIVSLLRRKRHKYLQVR
jgi:hypothetical protein